MSENQPAERHWLWKLTAPDFPGSGKSKDIVSRPHRIKHGGETWTVATDGRALVALREAVLEFGYPVGELAENTEKQLSDKMKYTGQTRPVDLAELKEWAGEVVWAEPCPACKGISRNNEYVSCSFCDGDGDVTPEPRRGWLYGVPIDRRRLACALEHFAGNGTLYLQGKDKHGQDEQFWVVGEGWIVSLMPMVVDNVLGDLD